MRVGQIGETNAQVVTGGFKGAARAGRSPLELSDNVLAGKAMLIDTGTLFGLQGVGKIEQITELFGSQIAQVDEVLATKSISHDRFLSFAFTAQRAGCAVLSRGSYVLRA